MSEATHQQAATDQAQTWRDDFSRVLSPVFGSPQLDLVQGEGSYVWDAAGKQYLDLLAGIAVNALGHCHPAWVNAITEQASTLGHISNFFTSPAQIALAEQDPRDPQPAVPDPPCSSRTREPKPMRRPSRWPGAPPEGDAPSSSPSKAPSTAAPWARWR